MNDGTGLAEALLGLDGFRVLEVSETPCEVVITVETTADFVGCGSCGVRAAAHERKVVPVRDLACFGRPARLVWRKRRWRCVDPHCAAKTWTDASYAGTVRLAGVARLRCPSGDRDRSTARVTIARDRSPKARYPGADHVGDPARLRSSPGIDLPVPVAVLGWVEEAVVDVDEIGLDGARRRGCAGA